MKPKRCRECLKLLIRSAESCFAVQKTVLTSFSQNVQSLNYYNVPQNRPNFPIWQLNRLSNILKLSNRIKQLVKIQKLLIYQQVMPFLFHSKKQSIFEKKPVELTEEQVKKIQQVQRKLRRQPYLYKVNTAISKAHPFRKLHQQQYQLSKDPQYMVQPTAQKMIEKNVRIGTKKYSEKFNQQLQGSQTLKQQQIKNQFQRKELGKSPLKFQLHQQDQTNARIHQSENKCQKTQSLNQLCKNQQKNQERLKYKVNDTPGPGSYDLPQFKNSNIYMIPPSKNRNYPLTPKNQLILQNMTPKKSSSKGLQQLKNLKECSYKNQNSSCFKQSVLSKKKLKGNSSLINLILSKKSRNQLSQSLTTCQSSGKLAFQNKLDEQFQKVYQKSPNPFSYNPNINFSYQKPIGSVQVFISNVPKFADQKNVNLSPGPGCYRQSFNQNQNKTKIGPWKDNNQMSEKCAFNSKVPRQLQFDNGQQCKQQLYYSPKNNIFDQIQSRNNESSKFYFGSSLQRFNKDCVQETDPYKYSSNYFKLSKKSYNCASLKYTGQRKLFDQIPSDVSPDKYHNITNTISKQMQIQLFKRLLKSKYQDQVMLIKQKKQNMEKVLIDQKIRNIDIKNGHKQFDLLNPDRYKQFLANKKRAYKKKIAFGNNKNSLLKRSIQGRKELDTYYETEPDWNVKSFNKFYGYEVEQNYY